ncbi:MAG: PAS domain-containing protein [Deltaproteobacteria bacterium]|nr:PAS domain-containing protein [Deltaproteobacteria bacterium]
MAADTQIGFFLNQTPALMMVLNRHRQVVYVNPALLQTLGLAQAEELPGGRPRPGNRPFRRYFGPHSSSSRASRPQV